MRRFYSVSEVASRFDVTSQTVRDWIAGGRLQAVQPGRGGRYRIPPPALLAFAQDSGLTLADDPRMRTVADARLSTSIAAELERIVGAIVSVVHPDQVILFGSRARGDGGDDSDFDLAVIAPDGSARRRVAMQAYESLAIVAGRSIGVDIVVLTPSMLGSERDLAGSVVRAVSRDGVVVYESSEVTS